MSPGLSQDLADRLRRLGLGQGAAALKPPEQRRPAQRVENLLPGRLVEHDDRACFVTEEHYPLSQRHGALPLGALLDLSTEVAAAMSQAPDLARLSFDRFLFLDTETTGLSAGAGTIAFLVGVGFFEADRYTVRQYFLRSPADEPALLTDLAAMAADRPGIISFNGRGFDLPLLEARYVLHRRRPPFVNAPHLDLLQPARRLWRDRLDSCRLIALEAQVLQVQRDQADVPSSVIPLIYRDYLLTGNGIEMPRIFYHNRIDVLSMVTLAARLCASFDQPAAAVGHDLEWFALAKWYEGLGLIKQAETAYRQAIGGDLPPAVFQEALFLLGRLLKRLERRDEAAVVWQQLAAVEMADVRGHVELAKYHEWSTGELDQAHEWTRRALMLVERWPKGVQALARPELAHRLARLGRKLAP